MRCRLRHLNIKDVEWPWKIANLQSHRQRHSRRHERVRARRAEVGYIERVMINKVSGKVSYAVLNFGGLFGIGDDHDPLP